MDVHFQIWPISEHAESSVECHAVTSEGGVRKKRKNARQNIMAFRVYARAAIISPCVNVNFSCFVVSSVIAAVTMCGVHHPNVNICQPTNISHTKSTGLWGCNDRTAMSLDQHVRSPDPFTSVRRSRRCVMPDIRSVAPDMNQPIAAAAGNCGNRNGQRLRRVSVCRTKRVRCVARLRLHIRSRNTTHLHRKSNRATFRSGLHPPRLRLLYTCRAAAHC